MLLRAMNVGHEEDKSRISIGPRFEGTRPKSAGELLVSMHTPAFSMRSQTRAVCSFMALTF